MNRCRYCHFGVAGFRIGITIACTAVLGIPIAIYIILPLFTSKLPENYQFIRIFGAKTTKKDHSVATRPLLQGTKRWEGVPNVVNLVWCQGGGSFTFENYLTARSALITFQPDLLNFQYVTELPQIEVFRYNTWLEDLNSTVHNFIANRVDKLPDYCSKANGKIYADSSGIYLDATIIVTPSILTSKPVLLMQGNVTSARTFHCSQFSVVADSQSLQQLPICFTLKSNEGPLYPAAFFEKQTSFGRFLRSTIYGTEEALVPKRNPQSLIPLICHYIWLGGGTVEFLLYLSILSCLNVVKANSVLVHGDEEPRGPLWKELVDRYTGRVVYIYRPQQKTVFGIPVTKLSPMSDVLRMDILLKYGGIYTDWDAVWVKPLDASIRQYESVVSLDWPGHLQPYPDTLNLGVMATKPNAAFLHHLQEGLHDFVDGVGPTQWCYICLKAYKVYERYPQTVRLDRHLQVISFKGFYHPAWLPGFKEVQFRPPKEDFDWRRGDTYALHWTWPTPLELRALKFLRQFNTTAAEAARFILNESGIKT